MLKWKNACVFTVPISIVLSIFSAACLFYAFPHDPQKEDCDELRNWLLVAGWALIAASVIIFAIPLWVYKFYRNERLTKMPIITVAIFMGVYFISWAIQGTVILIEEECASSELVIVAISLISFVYFATCLFITLFVVWHHQ